MIKLLQFAMVLTAIMLIACEPDFNQNFKKFVIKKGHHYTESRQIESLQQQTLRFEAKFDNSAIYLFDDAGFQDSKNKLAGVTDCNSLHHENSARFGWQWYHNQIEIFAYCYVNGKREEHFLGATMPGRIDRYELEVRKDSYLLKFNESEVSVPRGASCQIGFYEMLWPYFGGQLPAPHDVTIDIRFHK